VLFDELDIPDFIDTESKEFLEIVSGMLRLIVSSREYQFA